MKLLSFCSRSDVRTRIAAGAIFATVLTGGFLSSANTMRFVPTPEDRSQAFIDSIVRGDYEQVEQFLSQGVDPNTRDPRYRTALYVATSTGHNEIATLLRARGASETAHDMSGLEKRIGGNLNSSMRNYLETLDRQMLSQQAKLESK